MTECATEAVCLQDVRHVFFFFFFREICIYFPADKEEKRLQPSLFQPILMFYNGNMKHWLSLISLKAFHCETYVQSKRAKAFLFSSGYNSRPLKEHSLSTHVRA